MADGKKMNSKQVVGRLVEKLDGDAATFFRDFVTNKVLSHEERVAALQALVRFYVTAQHLMRVLGMISQSLVDAEAEKRGPQDAAQYASLVNGVTKEEYERVWKWIRSIEEN